MIQRRLTPALITALATAFTLSVGQSAIAATSNTALSRVLAGATSPATSMPSQTFASHAPVIVAWRAAAQTPVDLVSMPALQGKSAVARVTQPGQPLEIATVQPLAKAANVVS